MNPNPQQQAVIEHFEGPCLVLAVPGSGKTASVTERVKRLVACGVDPKSILAITFTNKAANEMKSRIAAAVGSDKASLMTISTFHSLCARVVRANCDALGLSKSYSIYDADDQERLLKTCIRKIEDADEPEPGPEGDIPKARPTKFSPSRKYMQSLMGYIEGSRNALLSDQEAVDKYDLSGNQMKVAIEYFAQLRQSNALDFTGLLSEGLRLFKERPDIRDRYRNRFRFVSVDEVQDTNLAQYEMIKQLCLGHKNVLLVGDLDQSIYKFRAANPENILQFEKDFAPCKILKLEKNHRSTPSILRYSQTLIEHNTLRKDTELVTDNLDASPPKIISGETDVEMAIRIAGMAEARINAGTKPCQVAILYRTNYASRVLENALRDKRLKYKIIGGMSFWDRKEVKFGLAILKLLCNENDRMAFEKSCEACCRGFGEKSMISVADIAAGDGKVMAAARSFAGSGGASARALQPLLEAYSQSSPIEPGRSLLAISQATAFWSRLQADSTDTNDRCANLTEMARDVDEYCSKKNNTLAGYLQNISLLTDADDDNDDENTIKLMTLHGCKGLEFDSVFVSHCNEGVIPHARIAEEARSDAEYEQAVEEERRLLYVGMTRAKKSLVLCFAKSKADAKAKHPKPAFPSKFLYETGIRSADLDAAQRQEDGEQG